MHTYTIHLPVVAGSDAEALAIRDRLAATGEAIHPTFVDVTDSDDWAEHVSLNCQMCGEPATDRHRAGGGGRRCQSPACQGRYGDYPIQDIYPRN